MMRTPAVFTDASILRWPLAVLMCAALVACSDDTVPKDENTPPENQVCTENDTRNVACGEDDAGVQPQVCQNDAWVDAGICDIPDDGCTDGDIRTATCGEDDEGAQEQLCEDGEWSDVGECQLDSETCTDGDTRTGICGAHDNGQQPEICEDGEWIADGECVDSDACILNDDSNPRCAAAIVKDAEIQLPAKFWQNKTLEVDNPPALTRVDASQLQVTDLAGQPVVFEIETAENGNQTLTWSHIEGEKGQKYEIVRGEYPFTIVDDQDEVIAHGMLPIRGTSKHERTFVFKGLSLDVENDGDSAREVTLSDNYGDPVEPIHVANGEDFVRRDYIIPSNTHYRYDVPATESGLLGEHRPVLSPTDAQRYVTIAATPAIIVAYDVTKGAEFGAWIKRNSRHFSRFDGYSVIHDTDASTAAYDRYLVYAKSNEQFSVHASLPGDFVKEVQVVRLAEAPEEPIVIDIEPAPADAVGNNGYMEADIYSNAPHAGVISLYKETTGAQSFTLDVLRVWQAMEGAVFNLFFEPTFFVDVYGDNNIAITPSKTPGRERFRIDALDDGVSVVTIGYSPIRLTQTSSTLFNAIAPDKLATFVVQVGELNEDNIALNIDSTEYDTWYFDNAQADHAPLRVEPTADADITDVCVHAPLHNATWGEGWNCFAADADETYTIELKEGRNIVRARTENSTVYQVVTARGLDISVENSTNPGEALSAGGTAKITLVGLSTPVQKIAGIYNPAFGQVYVEYDMNGVAVKGPGSQFFISTTGSVLELPVEDSGEVVLSNGRIHSNHFGSGLDAHKSIAAEGHGPNLNAPAIADRDYFSVLPDLVLQVQ